MNGSKFSCEPMSVEAALSLGDLWSRHVMWRGKRSDGCGESMASSCAIVGAGVNDTRYKCGLGACTVAGV